LHESNPIFLKHGASKRPSHHRAGVDPNTIEPDFRVVPWRVAMDYDSFVRMLPG
jgi:hypothetical protein